MTAQIRLSAPAPYALPSIVPGWQITFDGAPVRTMFADYGIHLSAVVTETATGRTYRAHLYWNAAGLPCTEGVQLNYLGKRAGAPVRPDHLPHAWTLAKCALHDLGQVIRDELHAEPAEARSPAHESATFRAKRGEDNRAILAADKARRAEAAKAAPVIIPMGQHVSHFWQSDAATDEHCRDCGCHYASNAAALPCDPEAVGADVIAARKAERERMAAETISAPAPVRTIDVTPTWAAVLPMLRAAVESGTGEGRRIAWEELARMAKAADSALTYQAQRDEQSARAVKAEELAKSRLADAAALRVLVGKAEALVCAPLESRGSDFATVRDLRDLFAS